MLRQTLDTAHQCLITLFLGVIVFYRLFLNPLFGIGNCCRFYPSCSEYSETAVKRFGLIQGLKLTILRILRCHPFHSGGVDPVPSNPNKELKTYKNGY